MRDEERDKDFDYLRGQSPEQQEAADDVEPNIEDAPKPGDAAEDLNPERTREAQGGL
jgi:hypothetical protein